jgi:hypothetical protein
MPAGLIGIGVLILLRGFFGPRDAGQPPDADKPPNADQPPDADQPT